MLELLRRNGIRDPAVLDAMGRVPREEFVIPADRDRAYADSALSIGEGQTISQPLMVAVMVEAARVRPGDRVLDVGTGSGYQAAVLAECGADVVGIELLPELAAAAEERLRRLGYAVSVRAGDGSVGLPDDTGGFDAIVVAAAAPGIPEALIAQLRPGGRLVIPVRSGPEGESLLVAEQTAAGMRIRDLGPCRFVPLRGAAGFRFS